MPYVWSENARHIQSLYRPWQEVDGYDEEVIRAAEARLGYRLPAKLRALYQNWGARDDMLRKNEYVLPPEDLFIASDMLIFCYTQPGSSVWGMPLSVPNDNPPVYSGDVNYSTPTSDSGEIEIGPLSHERLSDFLDALIYNHAFCGGSLHGGWSHEVWTLEWEKILERDWDKVAVKSVRWGLTGDTLPRLWPLYVRDGQAIDAISRLIVATRTEKDLRVIAQALDVTWNKQW